MPPPSSPSITSPSRLVAQSYMWDKGAQQRAAYDLGEGWGIHSRGLAICRPATGIPQEHGDLYLGNRCWFEPRLLQVVSLREKAQKEAGRAELCQRFRDESGLICAYSWLPVWLVLSQWDKGDSRALRLLAAVGCILALGARDKVSVLTRCTWSGSSRAAGGLSLWIWNCR